MGLEPDSEGVVIGVAFEFAEEQQSLVIAGLRKREGESFALESCPLLLSHGCQKVMGLVPINSRRARTYIGNLALADRISMARAAHGTSGSCVEYARNLHAHLRTLGIRDTHVEEFVADLSKERRVTR